MQTSEIIRYRRMLGQRLAKLENRLDELETALDAPAPADFEERATEREGDEVMERLGQSGLAETDQIKAALHRIEDGSFGICAGCGETISIERLDILPHTPRCRKCA